MLSHCTQGGLRVGTGPRTAPRQGGRSGLVDPEGPVDGVKDKTDKASQRVTQVHLRIHIAQVRGLPVSEGGPWEIEQNTTTQVPCPKHHLGAWGWA